jgi:hypothetical protein
LAPQVSLIATFFLLPETKYNRNSTASGVPGISSGHESETATDAQKGSGTATEVDDAAITPASHPYYPNLHKGRPSKVQFSVIPRPRFHHGLGMVLRDVISPLQIFAFPIVLWASLAMGFAANCLLALNLTQAQVFGPPPYHFNPAQIGFVNFAFVVGAIIGLLTAGPVSDWVSMRATKRNNGIREAEMRLVALIPFIAICLVGMTVSSHKPSNTLPFDTNLFSDCCRWIPKPVAVGGYRHCRIRICRR